MENQTNWRELCEELMQLDAEQPTEYSDWKQRWNAVTRRAHAALAQPEPEVVGPTDEELWQVGDEDFRANTWPTDAIRYARDVLARWGRPAPAPAGGEVAELVAWLRETGDLIQPSHLAEHQRYKRAADLLERQGAPVPVAVGERLSQPEDCDALGACWWYAEEYGWELQHREHPRSDRWSHWLPFHALPLPSGEVE